MKNKIIFMFSISFLILVSAAFDANAQSGAKNKFPFPDGYYCDYTIDKHEAMVVIDYPKVVYPLAEYGCKIVKYRKTDKGYTVSQTCEITENNPDANRNEHWELSSNKKAFYLDGTKFTTCRP